MPRALLGRRARPRGLGPGRPGPPPDLSSSAAACHCRAQFSGETSGPARHEEALGSGVRPEHAERLDAALERVERVADRAPRSIAPLEIGEEHVVAEPHPPGRDSILVRLTPRSASSREHATSAPGDASLKPQKTIEVFSGPGALRRRAGRLRAGEPDEAGHVVGAGPRRPRPGPRSRRAPPRAGCRSPPRARRGRRRCARPRRCDGRRRALAPRQPLAQEARALRDAPAGGRPRARSPPSSVRSRAIRQWRIGCTTSADDRAPPSASPASASSVAVTEPSSEFSIGTTARSTAPAARPSPSRRRSRTATSLERVAGGDARSASSVNVPAGPRKATRIAAAPATQCGASAERGVDRLQLLGRELELRLALAHLLDVHARLVAVEDRGDHHAGPVSSSSATELDCRPTSRRRRRSGRASGRRRSRRCAAPRRPPARRGAPATPPPSRAGRRTPSRAARRGRPGRARSCPPRTALWAGRTRRSLSASTTARISARSAERAPAASATIPCRGVEVVDHGGPEAYGVKVAGEGALVVVGRLLARDRLDRHRELELLAGRRLPRSAGNRGGLRLAWRIDSTSPSSSIGWSPPSIAIVTGTSYSSFSPWFVTSTSNARSRRRLDFGRGSLGQRLAPRLDRDARRARCRGGRAPPRCPPPYRRGGPRSASQTDLGWSQSMSGRKRLCGHRRRPRLGGPRSGAAPRGRGSTRCGRSRRS